MSGVTPPGVDQAEISGDSRQLAEVLCSVAAGVLTLLPILIWLAIWWQFRNMKQHLAAKVTRALAAARFQKQQTVAVEGRLAPLVKACIAQWDTFFGLPINKVWKNKARSGEIHRPLWHERFGGCRVQVLSWAILEHSDKGLKSSCGSDVLEAWETGNKFQRKELLQSIKRLVESIGAVQLNEIKQGKVAASSVI